jgi:hypothetical protein
MKPRTYALSLPLLIAASLILVGCSSDPDGGVLASDTGQLTIEIHDHAMPQIAECWITIDAVHARRQHGEWMPLAGNYPHHFDLVQLQGGRTRVLGSGSVPAENYDHIRVRMTSAHLVMIDGEEVDVPLPDGGLEIPVPMGRSCEVTRGAESHVSMDFRIPTSFQHHADESWTCEPDVIVDDVWQHGHNGHHEHAGSQ